MNVYETEKLRSEYLLFHYGSASEIAPPPGSHAALDFAVHCVRECLEPAALPAKSRALDLGCAVGRSSFELARHCTEVVGVDFSRRFIETATRLQKSGVEDYERIDEGRLVTHLKAAVPQEIDRSRVQFEVGDAMNLRRDAGSFDVVLIANLIDRLTDPAACLSLLPSLVKPGGQLIITSPYTWLSDFTPFDNWLGGFLRDGISVSTLRGLHDALDRFFDLKGARELPFLIREHARKFQWSVAQATIWRRKTLIAA